MVLVYENLQNWMILKVNVDKYPAPWSIWAMLNNQMFYEHLMMQGVSAAEVEVSAGAGKAGNAGWVVKHGWVLAGSMWKRFLAVTPQKDLEKWNPPKRVVNHVFFFCLLACYVVIQHGNHRSCMAVGSAKSSVSSGCNSHDQRMLSRG